MSTTNTTNDSRWYSLNALGTFDLGIGDDVVGTLRTEEEARLLETLIQVCVCLIVHCYLYAYEHAGMYEKKLRKRLACSRPWYRSESCLMSCHYYPCV